MSSSSIPKQFNILTRISSLYTHFRLFLAWINRPISLERNVVSQNHCQKVFDKELFFQFRKYPQPRTP
ncbi:hypothetical protein HanPSC8_Chr04g0180961 [Helianthus annuus]|nr:hypothetical protein HanPSC8_Chr04g0180961 [Helianthus annuus]